MFFDSAVLPMSTEPAAALHTLSFAHGLFLWNAFVTEK